jgi:hypothetical protein
LGKLIIGDNIQVDQAVTDLVVINNEGEYDSTDEGKIFLGATAVVNPAGEIEGVVSPRGITISSGDTTTALNKNYFCDASGGAFVLALSDDLNEYTAVKIDATVNTVTLQPSSGLINGAASYTLTAQYQKVTIIYDGTNYYV